MISLRTRLALWSVGVLALALFVSGVLVYLTVQQALLEKVDATLAARAQSAGMYIVVAERPPYFVPENLAKTLANFASAGFALQVTDVDGRVLARSPGWGLGRLPGGAGPAAPAQGRAIAPISASGAGGAVRYYITPLYAGRNLAGFLSVAQSLDATRQTLDTLSRNLLLAGALALFLAAAIMLGLAQRALRPVAAITQTARAIAESRQLSQRVPYRGPPDEIGQLAATFNEMLASLDETQMAQKRFVADASHELRTPLTSILGNAEAMARAPDAPREERVEALMDVIAEARRLSRLVGGLLSLARADAGQELACENVRLDALAGEMAAQVRAAHPGAAVELSASGPVYVWGDADRLREVILILLDNAVKYSPTSAPVVCLDVDSLVDAGEGHARLRVRDHGIGISAGELPHIFERFYRAPRARRHDPGGAGLGLSIASWIVEQHHGSVDVRSAEGEGTTITVLLPLSTPCDDAPPRL
jgi:signal transduction histidine kinase